VIERALSYLRPGSFRLRRPCRHIEEAPSCFTVPQAERTAHAAVGLDVKAKTLFETILLSSFF